MTFCVSAADGVIETASGRSTSRDTWTTAAASRWGFALVQLLAPFGFPNYGTFPQEIAHRSPHFRRMAALRDSLDGAQAVTVISVPFTTRSLMRTGKRRSAVVIISRGVGMFPILFHMHVPTPARVRAIPKT
jgi:hypothetical protein